MVLDIERGHFYWSSLGRKMIIRGNIDGSDLRRIHAGQLVAVDTEARKMYVLLDSTLHRTDLDGTDGEVLFKLPDLGSERGIPLPPVAIDLEAKKVYWLCGGWPICRANLDGTEQGLFFDPHGLGAGIGVLSGLTVDAVGGLYMQSMWGDFARVNVDGSGFEIFKHDRVQDIAVDGEQGKMYWVESALTLFIRRSNLDGSDVENLIPVEGKPTAITLDASNDVLMWNSPHGIWRSKLDGSNVEQIVSTNLDRPHGVTVDHARGHVYWTNGKSIVRSGLDGLHQEVLVDGLEQWVGDVAIDPQGGFLYWALTESQAAPSGWGAGKIQRSRMDGSEIEDLVILPQAIPTRIELDLDNERMFWASGEGIFAARIDGSEATKIVAQGPGSAPPIDLAIDADQERIYWLRPKVWPGHEIGWTSMDGSVSETLFQGSQKWTAMAVDPHNGYVYWGESPSGVWEGSSGTIWRGSLTGGSEKELVASELGFVSSLTIDLRTSTDVASEVVPSRFDLHQNYPNPFNPATSIRYILTSSERISIKVRDALGRIVAVLVDEVRPAGTHQVIWGADRDQPSGVYFYTLETGSGAVTRSMLLLK